MDYRDYSTLIMDHSGSVCYICDMETYELLYLSRAGMDIYGIQEPEAYRGQKCHKVLQGLDEPCPFCSNDKLTEGQDYRWEHYNQKLGRWFDVTDTLICQEGRACRLEIARDITARKGDMVLVSGQMTMEDVLFHCLHTLTSEGDLNAAVNLFLEAIGRYYQANRAYIFEFDLQQQTISNTFEWCYPGVSVEIDNLQNLPVSLVDDWIRKFESDGEFFITSVGRERDTDSEEYRILKNQGIESLLAAPLYREGRVVGFIGVDDPKRQMGDLTLLRSVTRFVLAELEKRRLMAELEELSYTDVLTGLKNRNQYNRVLREFDRKTPDTLGVITIDINGLKEVNDTHGQDYGDYVIKQTAKVLQEHFSEDIYRVGGDEFVVLCMDISKEGFKEKLVVLRQAFDRERDCDVSIGCAFSFDDVDVHTLLQQADEMRDAEKQSYYHAVLSEGRSIARTGFSSEVLQEIKDNRFVVYYQPQVDIRTGKVVGAEALVRKKAEDGGLIPPNRFIPFYEVGGVISYVDLYVLKTACAAIRQWMDQGYSLHVSVNFSRVTLLEPDIVEVITQICEEHGVPPSAIIIEVTESIGKMDNEQLKDLIGRLKAAGFSISLDDFGSQYSNLSILAAMDFDEIKFDRTLVNTLEQNKNSRVVMKNSVNMCQDLEGTASLAEGIETKGQLELLLDYQCNYGQGYYFARPVPQEEFDVFLRENSDKM